LKTLNHLFDNNLAWATSIKEKDPEFFRRLSKQQAPEYLWIGCSDSRVPANQITGLLIVPKVLAVYTAFHGYDKRTA
jgi:carbonic anhydrase